MPRSFPEFNKTMDLFFSAVAQKVHETRVAEETRRIKS